MSPSSIPISRWESSLWLYLRQHRRISWAQYSRDESAIRDCSDRLRRSTIGNESMAGDTHREARAPSNSFAARRDPAPVGFDQSLYDIKSKAESAGLAGFLRLPKPLKDMR